MTWLSPEAVAETLSKRPQLWLDVGHAKLAHYSFGAGPDLLFVHGWPLSGATWRNLIPQLAPHFTCHLIDMPGAGRSQHSRHTKFGLRAHADTLIDAIDALDLSSVVLVGHDSGGAIARFAAAKDSRIVGIVSGNTEIPGHMPWLVQLYRVASQIPFAAPLVRLAMQFPFVRRSPIGFAGPFTDPAYIEGDFREWFVKPLIRDAESLSTQLGHLRAISERSETDALHEAHAAITIPVRLVWGTADPIFPISKVPDMLRAFAGPVVLKTVEGAKAFLHEDHAQEFASHVHAHANDCFRLRSREAATIA